MKKQESEIELKGFRSPSDQKRVIDINEKKIELEEKKYDVAWKSCCLTFDRRAVKYFTQLAIGLIVIFFCFYKLSDKKISCDSSNVYVGLLSSTIAIFLPAPSL